MWFQAKLYFKYLRTRKTRYDIHSPFVFDFINNVLRNKQKPSNNPRIELLKNKLAIEKHELGAGSQKNKSTLTIAKSTRVSAVNRKYSRLLFHITQHYQPESILEFGTHFGLGTLAFHEGYENAFITSVEGCPNTYSIAQQNISKHANQPQQISLVQLPFDQFIKNHKDQLYSCIYIDGNHKKNTTLQYFDFAVENAEDFCIIILDDINWSKDMQSAWNKIVNENKYYTIDLFRMGIVVINKPLKAQHFVLKY